MASLAQFSKISAMPNDWSIYEKFLLIGFQVYNGGLNQISDEFLAEQFQLGAHPPTNITIPLPVPIFGIFQPLPYSLCLK